MNTTIYGNRGTLLNRPAEEPVSVPMGVNPFGSEDTGDMQGTLARIGKEHVTAAISALTKYKAGKANLETRIVEDEMWYKLRHWEVMNATKPAETDKKPAPSSAWLFNALQNKHADAVDNYPEPNVLPREPGDVQSASALSKILPVVVERNDFEQTYSDNWHEKLKHGTAVYGVFWNPKLENGLGDIDIRPIDLLNIFWEPGITDIQKSRYLFIVDLMDKDIFDALYPDRKGEGSKDTVKIAEYVYDDTVDTSDKVAVIDCYYKVMSPTGKNLVHLMKFSNLGEPLYASENDPAYADVGFYDHGEYPVVFDTLFPEKGTPVGFGYIAITKDPQLYIDRLGAYMLENAMLCTRPRHFVSDSAAINKAQFIDIQQPIIEVAGRIDDNTIKPVQIQPLPSIAFEVYQQKIEELKETAANRDVNSGSTGGGVTAAAAIAALQEAGNKASRDMIAGSYRSYTQIMYLCIENIRQFYDEARTFRITGNGPGGVSFIDFSNAGIKDQAVPSLVPGAPDTFRRPVFDVKVRAEKRNPYTQMAMNETAKELYRLGCFNPEKAQEALIMLEMMEFDGIDGVIEKVKQGQTMLMNMQQMAAQMDAMGQALGFVDENAPQQPKDGGSVAAPKTSGNGKQTLASQQQQAQQSTMTSYGQKLAARANPIAGNAPNKTNPTGGK